ncbi:DE-cadherin-like [Anopheles funestus]|uniref:DE-cadherin-like n=1 Tax=Anopheles funestus TaxID=62324 RepID=UPI0020C74468|nr:DE-cadherin-like [Anopheles funestus]
MANQLHCFILVITVLLGFSSCSSVSSAKTVNNTVTILDINDNPPIFDKDIYEVTVTKDMKQNQSVITITATEIDEGDNNVIHYDIVQEGDDSSYFEIDKKNGLLMLTKSIDRDLGQFYAFHVRTYNESLEENNKRQTVVKVIVHVVDSTNSAPYFIKMPLAPVILNETFQDFNKILAEFEAVSNVNEENIVIYRISYGNYKQAFLLEQINNTAYIKLGRRLDYEMAAQYMLTVRATNSLGLNAETFLRITIMDENDNTPEFIGETKGTVLEHQLPGTFVMQVHARDRDGTAPNNVVSYRLRSSDEQFFQIDSEKGIITTREEFDRQTNDAYIVTVIAEDSSPSALFNNGEPNTKTQRLLIRIVPNERRNDYKPQFKRKIYAVDYLPENATINTRVVKVTAYSQQLNSHLKYSIVKNNVANVFKIDENTGLISVNNHLLDYETIPEYKLIVKADDGLFYNTVSVWIRIGNVKDNTEEVENLPPAAMDDEDQNKSPFLRFDHEDQKEYEVPIKNIDSAVIDDENDNKMKQAESHIVVNKYKGMLSDMNIGRVYIIDSDDWDLSDKTFLWDKATSAETLKFFKLNNNTGMITMLKDISCGQYNLRFHVTEKSDHFSPHHVSARATVLVKEISKKSVAQSGSIRFYNVTADDFVSQTPGHLRTPLNRLQNSIATILKASPNDVDIFTINNRKLAQGTFLDVFFAVSGSVYSTSELLNSVLSFHLHRLEEDVGFPIEMIGIDECELKTGTCEQSCRNKVYGSSKPIVINANANSFIGITAFVQLVCISDTSPSQLACLNGGTHIGNRCICPNSFDGPHCEMIDISFNGNGYALFSTIISDNIANISVEMLPQQTDGLVLYIGPMSYNTRVTTQPFVALEIVDGRFVLLLDDGTEAIRIENQQVISQNDALALDILFKLQSIEMSLVINKLMISRSRYVYKDFKGVLITNGHVQLGKTAIDLNKLGSLYNWTYMPQTRGYSGCLRNLTINGHTIDFQQTILTKNMDLSCPWAIASEANLWNILMVVTAATILLTGISIVCFSLRSKLKVLTGNYEPLICTKKLRKVSLPKPCTGMHESNLIPISNRLG